MAVVVAMRDKPGTMPREAFPSQLPPLGQGSQSTGSIEIIAQIRLTHVQLKAARIAYFDEAVFDEYGGCNKALRRSEKLERLLKEKTAVIGYEISMPCAGVAGGVCG